MTGWLTTWLHENVERARLAGNPAAADAYGEMLRRIEVDSLVYLGPPLTRESAEELIEKLRAAFLPENATGPADEPIVTAEGTPEELDAALDSVAGRLWLAYRARENTARSAMSRPFPILSAIDCMRRAMVATGVR